MKISPLGTLVVLLPLISLLSGCGSSSDPLAVGNLAPDFKVAQPDDPSKIAHLAELKGKVVLVDFWATWCAPCRAALPGLQKLWKENQSNGLEMVAISKESPDDIMKFKSESGFEIPFYEDVDDKANNAFQITGYPTTLVIGKDGRVVYSSVGTGDGVEEEIRTAISKALQ